MKSNQFSWRDFIFGFFVGAFVIGLFAFGQLKSYMNSSLGVNSAGTTTKVDGGSVAASSETLTTYNTSVKEWNITADDGEKYHFVTPSGYYSLTDQYVASLQTYYGLTTSESNLICIGDNAQQYASKILINAAPLSKTMEIIRVLYQDDETVNLDEFTFSEAYQYMLSGKVTEDDTVQLKELDSVQSSDGTVYRVFITDRDTEYYTDDTMSATETVHSTELSAYTDTEDAIEIIIYMETFNQEQALQLLQEFID